MTKVLKMLHSHLLTGYKQNFHPLLAQYLGKQFSYVTYFGCMLHWLYISSDPPYHRTGDKLSLDTVSSVARVCPLCQVFDI